MSLPLGLETFDLCFWLLQNIFAFFNSKSKKCKPSFPSWWEQWLSTIQTAVQRARDVWSCPGGMAVATSALEMPRNGPSSGLSFLNILAEGYSVPFSNLNRLINIWTTKASFGQVFIQKCANSYVHSGVQESIWLLLPSVPPEGLRQEWQVAKDALFCLWGKQICLRDIGLNKYIERERSLNWELRSTFSSWLCH